MSRESERKAAELADDYFADLQRGSRPTHDAYLSRCPRTEVERLQAALDGIDFMMDAGRIATPVAGAIQQSFAYMQEIRKKRHAVAEAWRRSTEGRMHVTPANPEEYICAIFDFPAALAISVDKTVSQSFGLWHRGARSGSVSAVRNDEMRLRLVERRLSLEADKLLTAALIDTHPIDVARIAEYLCLYVKEAELEGVDGCLITYEDLGGIILNSSITNSKRKRFTLAHEIGHYILHRKRHARFRDTMSDLGSRIDDEAEVEADTFASMLLMPFSQMPDKFGTNKPSFSLGDQIAASYDVSLAAALRRVVRSSNWACALVVLKDGKLNWSVRSPELEAYVKQIPHPTTGAAELALTGVSSDERARKLPVEAWFENQFEEGTEVLEQSRHVGNGYVYSLITVED